MPQVNWEQLRSLFEQVTALPEDQRQDFIEQVTEADTDMRRELESLLAADTTEHTLQTPIQQASDSLKDELDSRFTGQQIGPYEVTELLGKGGMGLVYRGRRVSGDFEQDVAIKFLRRQDPQLVRRMTEERQNLSALNHPNIAKIFDAGTTPDGSPYLVMEYIEGDGLAQYLDKNKLSLGRKLQLFQSICQAVDYSHRNLIIHRDLKPSNVMVNDQGLPKVIDYGIAKQLSLNGDEVEQTVTLQQAWSPNYASPEQVRGERLSTTTDIYALGLILYRLLLGEDAQQAQQLSLDKAVGLICRQSPEIPAGSIPKDLARIILKAVHKDPAQRYASARELSEDLRRFSRKQPVLAVGDGVGYRIKKWLERNKLSAAVAAVAVVLLGVSVQRIIAERNAAVESESRAVAAEADSRLQLQRANEVSVFLTDIFDAADIRMNAGEQPTAQTLLDRGFEDIQSRENLEPGLKIELLRTIARAYKNSALDAKALVALEQALTIWQSLEQGPILQHADILNDIGNVHLRMNNVELALPLLQQALAVQQQLLPADHPTVAATLENLGSTLVNTGQLEQARIYLYQAMTIMESNPDIPRLTLSAVYHNIARLERRSADLQKAVEYINRSLQIKDDIYATPGVQHLDSWNVRSQIARDMADWDQVLSDLQKMQVVASENLPADNWRQVIARIELANYHHDIGNFEAAEGHYLKGLEHPLIDTAERQGSKAVVLNNLGALYEDMQDYERALPFFEQSKAIRLEKYGTDSSSYATAVNNMGRLLIQLGRFDESQSHLQEAYTIQHALMDADHPRVIGTELLLLQLAVARGNCRQCMDQFQQLAQRMEQSDNQPATNWVRLYKYQAEYWESQAQTEQALMYWRQAYDHQVESVNAEHPFAIRMQQAIDRLGGT